MEGTRRGGCDVGGGCDNADEDNACWDEFEDADGSGWSSSGKSAGGVDAVVVWVASPSGG